MKYANSAISFASIAFSLLLPGSNFKLLKKLVLTIPGFIIVALTEDLLVSFLNDLTNPNNACFAET